MMVSLHCSGLRYGWDGCYCLQQAPSPTYQTHDTNGVKAMPLYEYRCKDCGDTFDMNMRIEGRDEPTNAPCSKCDGEVVRGVGCGGFELLGSGWEFDGYTTYAGDAAKARRK